MPVPTAYTEDELKVYLATAVLGSTADMLGWSVAGGDFDEIVADTLIAYGVPAIASATDVAKLRALARLKAWEAVVRETVLEINYTADGATFNREAIHQHAQAMVSQARVDAFVYGDGYQVDVYGVGREGDPYNAIEWDE